jgi:hypothetical protein
LHSATSKVSADIDVRGVLGVDPEVRKGFSSVDIEFDIDAECDADKELSCSRQERSTPRCSTCWRTRPR